MNMCVVMLWIAACTAGDQHADCRREEQRLLKLIDQKNSKIADLELRIAVTEHDLARARGELAELTPMRERAKELARLRTENKQNGAELAMLRRMDELRSRREAAGDATARSAECVGKFVAAWAAEIAADPAADRGMMREVAIALAKYIRRHPASDEVLRPAMFAAEHAVAEFEQPVASNRPSQAAVDSWLRSAPKLAAALRNADEIEAARIAGGLVGREVSWFGTIIRLDRIDGRIWRCELRCGGLLVTGEVSGWVTLPDGLRLGADVKIAGVVISAETLGLERVVRLDTMNLRP
ncbi:MAG: hypothetical protein U1A27_00195 [Phycisphaerae bacterium]